MGVIASPFLLFVAALVLVAAVPHGVGTGPDDASRVDGSWPQSMRFGHSTMVDLERQWLLANICTEITRKDATHRLVTRRAATAIWASLPELSRSIRLTVVPVPDRGSLLGLHISSLRPDSLAACLGFEDGDILRFINDIDVMAPETALRSYASLLASSVVRFTILRQGLPLVLEVTID
jgi:hypothetical protein